MLRAWARLAVAPNGRRTRLGAGALALILAAPAAGYGCGLEHLLRLPLERLLQLQVAPQRVARYTCGNAPATCAWHTDRRRNES